MSDSNGAAAAAAPFAGQGSDSHVPGTPSDAAAVASHSAPPLDPVYLANIGATGDELKGYERLGASLRADGVPAEAGNAILTWFQEIRQRDGPPAPEVAQHRFDVDASRYSPEDGPYLTHFLNAMQKAGATQRDVDVALKFYGKVSQAAARTRTEDARALEAARRQVAGEIGNEMRALDENEYPTNRQLVISYLRSLPAAERDATDALPMKDLIQRARTAGPSGSMTREQIETVMRTERGRYNRDLGMQARYRDLLRSHA